MPGFQRRRRPRAVAVPSRFRKQKPPGLGCDERFRRQSQVMVVWIGNLVIMQDQHGRWRQEVAVYGAVMNPRVSVILPFKNARATVARALRSLLDQTLRDIEVLLVDDGSTDGGAAVVEECTRDDGRVRLLQARAPGGVVAAVNTAWPLCRADLIARMDADDVSLPDRLERQCSVLESDATLGAVSCRVEVPGAGEGFQRYVDWSNSLVSAQDIQRERFVECPVVNPTVLARREAVEAVGGHLDAPWAEDYDLWLRFLGAGHRMVKLPEVHYCWYDDQPGRLTRTDARYSAAGFMQARAHYLALLPRSGQGFVLCGAGPTGKALAARLQGEGAHVHCFYDVNERRLGARIGGVPVVSGHTVPAAVAGGPIVLSCVGSPGGRQRVRGLVEHAGYIEGENFFPCA